MTWLNVVGMVWQHNHQSSHVLFALFITPQDAFTKFFFGNIFKELLNFSPKLIIENFKNLDRDDFKKQISTLLIGVNSDLVVVIVEPR